MKINRLIIVASVMISTWALGGIGAGNGFKHMVRPDFDFHIAYPSGWSFTETEVASEPGCGGDILCAKWLINNDPVVSDPAETSWVQTTFILNAPVSDLSELEGWASGLHPEIGTWYRDESGPFAKISSGDINDGHEAWKSTDYYLTRTRQVVKVVWRAHVTWRNSVDHIINSIDRAASEPEILKIEAEPVQAIPGQEACLRIEVDDLRDSFQQQGLSLSFTGQPDHYSLKRIAWVAEKNWYRVCVDVTSAFGSEGLYPTTLTLSSEDGRSRRCEREQQIYKCQKCVQVSPTVRECSMQPASFSVSIPDVQNAAIDRQGPTFGDVKFEEETKTLVIAAADPAGISVGEVYSDRGEKLLILPGPGAFGEHHLQVGSLLAPGWNTLKVIVLYDRNGMGGLLRDEGEHTYRYYDSHGRSLATDIAVINYFSVEAN